MSITRVKKIFIIFINLSLRKRQRNYKRASWLQTMEIETAVKKKKKKKYYNYFFFITIFSFTGALVDWVSARLLGPYPCGPPWQAQRELPGRSPSWGVLPSPGVGPEEQLRA